MQLHLHPTRCEALTASTTAITRWSLETNPPTVLAQFPTTPESVFILMYDPGARLQTFGGITGSPDGLLFAHEQLKPDRYRCSDPAKIEWRNWDDLSVAHAVTVPHSSSEIYSLGCSPDGRWLVMESVGRLFLLDWQTGEVMSHHAIAGGLTTGLTFDPTSTFVAAFSCHDNWGHFMLWRLDPAERALVRPQGEEWWTRDAPPDEVNGSAALSVVHWELDRTGIEWPYRDLADTACHAAFSRDSRLVIFNPMRGGYHSFVLELVAYEVTSGKRLWCTRREEENTGPFIFSPDGSVLLVPVQGGDLLVYRAEDGALVQRLPTGLSVPIQALAFEHDGRTLWLAIEEGLVQYQPQR
jgi:WD40 repeat protein